MKAILDNVHQQASVIQHENTNLKKDGSQIMCEWLNAPFKSKYDRNNFMLCMARDITERKQLEQQLKQAAHYDNLTGLANRSLILELLERALTMAARKQAKVALLFLDLNDFKAVNDRLGHDAGDLLLKIVAQRLTQAVRKADYVGRLGGDEFLVILQDIDTLESAQDLTRKLYEHLKQPCTIKTETVLPGASIGISLYPDNGKDGSVLLNDADQKMYRDKRDKRK
ncbi:MAG: sensor domain-containing diguanylate cyclase [Methylococcales bacterium]|nr:sensor domain-containing diguanylate cyclase [Methylococcales bacterium]